MTDRAGEQGPGVEAARAVGAKGPDELRRQIERTRSQLGETVQELAGRMDVKGRVQTRAADIRDKAGAMTVQLRSTAAQAGHTVHERATLAGHKVHDGATKAGHKVHDGATKAGHKVHDRAARTGHQAQDRALRAGHSSQDKATESGHEPEHRVEHGVPWPARPVVGAAVRHPRPTLVIGAALAVVVVVGWRYPKR
ncbi:DUF3618 domain-containing protein [Streptomyces sp. NBC_00005]|uniref:DUF3618 domain-containing protein n=1 Tax=Streptomyces sp. NBC_00005 TaxID=2903609 RepID=UPI00324F90DD